MARVVRPHRRQRHAMVLGLVSGCRAGPPSPCLLVEVERMSYRAAVALPERMAYRTAVAVSARTTPSVVASAHFASVAVSDVPSAQYII